jgi:hypothetical protein
MKTEYKRANDAIVRANALVMAQNWPATSQPYRDVVRATLALQRRDITEAYELASRVERALTPQKGAAQ